MTDNRIEVSSVRNHRIARYSSDSIKKSLSLAKKLSDLDCEQEAKSEYSDLNKLFEIAQKDLGIDATKINEKMREGIFDFDDFLKQMQMVKNMGSLGGLLKAIPGIGEISETELKQGEDQLKKAEIMIASMREEERPDPDLLAGSVIRQQRVAEDSGYSEKDIRKFIAEFKRMRSMMQQMSMGNISDADDEADIKSERDAEYYYDLGMEKYELEDYQIAIDNFTQSIRLDPDNAVAYCSRANSRYELEDYQGVIDDLTQSIKLDPDSFADANVYWLRANSRYELEDYQGVIDDLTQSIRLDPDDNCSTYSFRADAKEKLGYYQDAIDDYDLAIYKCKEKGESFQSLLHSRDRLSNKI
jgi:tetratricopeptide (TPR) repeat protein